jgi:ABC-2 type transport system permease protein
VLQGAAVMGYALWAGGWEVDPGRAAAFLLLFLCGAAMAYSFLVMLTATSVWLVRNQSLMEMWWLFTTLMRYPREIYQGTWGAPFGWFFTFVIPVIVVVNVPAASMVRVLEPWSVLGVSAAAGVLTWTSRRFFRYALQRYRSASS